MSDVDLLLLWLGCPLWLPLVVVLVMLVRKLPAHPGQGNTMIQQDEQEAEAWHGDP
jgi:TM2 domain-containing membrane protein YozV